MNDTMRKFGPAVITLAFALVVLVAFNWPAVVITSHLITHIEMLSVNVVASVMRWLFN